MKKPSILMLSLWLILAFSCADDDNASNDIDCTNIACTEIFVTISVTIKDMSGAVIPLDSFQVISAKDNEDLTRELSEDAFEIARENGTYPLFGDEYVSRFQNKSLDIIFKGSMDGNEVVNDTFKVGADCCHVQLLDGDTAIVIE